MLNATDYQYSELTAPSCTESGVACYQWNSDEYGNYQFYASVGATGHTDSNNDSKCDDCEIFLSMGDLDLDGDVDANDLTLLARHVGGIEVVTDPSILRNADVDGDGDIDASDLTVHARYVGGIIADWPQA